MSHEAVSWALHDAPMPLTEKGKPDTTVRLVLVELAEHASADGRNSYPAVLHIRHATGLDDRTIQRALRRLEASGLIQRDGVARNGCTRWKLHLSVTRPETDWTFLESEAEETKRRQSAARAARRARAAAASMSGTENAGHDAGNVELSGTENAGQATENGGLSGTQNPGVRHAESRRPARNATRTIIEPPGTITGGTLPPDPLRGNDPSGRFNEHATAPSEVVPFEPGLETQPTTRARVRCLHGLPAHIDHDTGLPTCALCRRTLEAS